MLQLWRGAKLFAQRLGWMEKGLLQVGLCAFSGHDHAAQKESADQHSGWRCICGRLPAFDE